MDRRVGVALLVGLVIIVSGTGWWYYTNVRCPYTLALNAPNSDFGFERDAPQGTLTITHVGGDALLDRGDKTNRGCREEWEPDVVSILVTSGSAERANHQWLWLARNGSGVGDMPLAKGSSVILSEPKSSVDGDIHLDDALGTGDIIRVVGRGKDGNAAVFGTYEIGNTDEQ